MRTVLLVAVVAASAGWIATATVGRVHAQTPANAQPAFEVASVKQNKSGNGMVRLMAPPGGRLQADNIPVRELIRWAYQVQGFQVIGGPSWINDDRFDIVAKSPEGTPPAGPPEGGTPSPLQMMMQNLLADRFKLKAHRETRDMAIYALVLVRSDGKLGPKIEASTTDCAALAGRGRGAPAGPPPPLQPGQRPDCGMFMGIANIAAGGVGMPQLAVALSPRVGRIVVDKTGLTGKYGFNLDFTPDQLPPGGNAPPGAPPVVNGVAIDLNGPSLFTALQEQLGLKLDSQRGPVDVLVIDDIEHPAED